MCGPVDTDDDLRGGHVSRCPVVRSDRVVTVSSFVGGRPSGAALFHRLDHRVLGPGHREDNGHLGRDLST
jgi:hypothetical protein